MNAVWLAAPWSASSTGHGQPARREDDLASGADLGAAADAEIAEPAGFGDAADRCRGSICPWTRTDTPATDRDPRAIAGRVNRNVAMIQQPADGGEPTFQRMLSWAADLERSGNEVAELPDEFWSGPDR